MKAVILLPEIYGKNRFIEDVEAGLQAQGFVVYTPDYYQGRGYDYREAASAYAAFYRQAGLDFCREVSGLVNRLSHQYERVYLLGFSVGASLAWRCSENPNCAGVIACYGSRIRDYLEVLPQCPTLLLFAEEDSFDVAAVRKALERKPNVTVETYPAWHGFLDCHSPCYDPVWVVRAGEKIRQFFAENGS